MVTISHTSRYRQQSNGQVERINQELGWFLTSHCQDRQGEWARFLPWAEYAQNLLHHSSTGLTPFQCVLGFQLALAPWTPGQTEAPVVDEWFRCAEKVWRDAHVRLQRAIHRQKEQEEYHQCPPPHVSPWGLSGSLPGISHSAWPAKS